MRQFEQVGSQYGAPMGRREDNPAMLEMHGVDRDDFMDWAKWSGVAMGQNPADYQWSAP